MALSSRLGKPCRRGSRSELEVLPCTGRDVCSLLTGLEPAAAGPDEAMVGVTVVYLTPAKADEVTLTWLD
jgi:hypothetical protein